MMADGQWPIPRILRCPTTYSGLGGKQAARAERSLGHSGRCLLMMLLESQARSEDLYAWAVKRSSRCGLTAPLSCLALGDNPLPRPLPLVFHTDRCPFSA